MTTSNGTITMIYEAWDAPLPARAPGTVRCVILSDTHGEHAAQAGLPEGDILIHLGDVANRGNLADIRSFRKFIQQEKYRDHFRHVVIIEGNHDRDILFRTDQAPKIDLELEYADFMFLRDQVAEVAGITILGVSWDSLVAAAVDPSFPMVQNAIQQQDSADQHHHHRRRIDLVLSHMHSPILENIVPSAQVHLFGHFHRQRGVVVQQQQQQQRTHSDDGDDGYGDSHGMSEGHNHHKLFLVNCASIPYNRPVVLDWNLSTHQVAMIHCPR
jgi:hypothetical protein